MAELNWADYLLIAVLGVSTVVSLFRGFFKEALSLAGWMVSLTLRKSVKLLVIPLLRFLMQKRQN